VPTEAEVREALEYVTTKTVFAPWVALHIDTILAALDKAQSQPCRNDCPHMAAFTRARSEQDDRLAALRADLLSEQNKNTRLVEALRYYAEEDYYEMNRDGSPDQDHLEDIDHGRVATAALKEASK